MRCLALWALQELEDRVGLNGAVPQRLGPRAGAAQPAKKGRSWFRVSLPQRRMKPRARKEEVVKRGSKRRWRDLVPGSPAFTDHCLWYHAAVGALNGLLVGFAVICLFGFLGVFTSC